MCMPMHPEVCGINWGACVSKRFTETEKWKKRKWREYPPIIKLFWLYLCDNCDPGGIWPPDMELAEFQIGDRIDMKVVQQHLSDRLHVMPDGKWFLRDFVSFQKGVDIKNLNPQNSAHVGVMRCLEKYTLTDFENPEQSQLFETSTCKGASKHLQRCPRVKVKEDVEVKEEDSKMLSLSEYYNKVRGKFTPEEQSLSPDFLDYWTETAPGGQKQRWQMEKVFDVALRFRTWIRNQKQWAKPGRRVRGTAGGNDISSKVRQGGQV